MLFEMPKGYKLGPKTITEPIGRVSNQDLLTIMINDLADFSF